MAEVQHEQTSEVMRSQVLWRYRPLPSNGPQQYELEQIVGEGKLFIPAARRFNDPFDLAPVVVVSDVPVAEQVKRVKRTIERDRPPPELADRALRNARCGVMNSPEYKERVKSDFLKELKNTPVLCFYPDWRSVKMWSGYSDIGTGYAIGLRFDERWDMGAYPLPVKYSDTRPKIDFADDVNHDGDARLKLLEASCLTKSSVWSEEQEHRAVFGGRKEGLIDFDSSIIEELCLGFNVDESTVERVLSVREAAGLSFQISKIELAEDSYELNKSVL